MNFNGSRPDNAAVRAENTEIMTNSAPGNVSAGTVPWITATAIVIADMVGVGVFTSLGFQVNDIKS